MNEFIELTVVTVRLKKETSDNIKSTFLKDKKSKDSYGRDAEFYRELGIEPPKELDAETQNEDGTFNVDESDLEVVESPAMFRLDSLVFFVAGEKEGSTIYLDIDYRASVKETVKEIGDIIESLNKKSKNVVK